MRGRTGWKLLALGAGAAVAGAAVAGGAVAAETLTYRYDARGRLVKVERSGAVNNGVTTQYSYDKADNRKARNVSGAAK